MRHCAAAAVPFVVALLASALPAQEVPEAGAPAVNGSTARPANDLGVEQEFKQLHALLAQLPESFGASRKWNAPDPCSDLAARLSVFPLRFGSNPRLAPQWPALQSAAQDLLNRLDDPAMREPLSDHDVPRQMDRFTLLDIVGRADEARAILDSVIVYGADGCAFCTAENGIVVYQRRSELCERAGDLQGALTWQHEACFELQNSAFVHPRPGEDLLYARYGLLLCRTGHGVDGEVALRAVVGLYPLSIGGRLAQAELTRRGVPVDGPKAAIEIVVLKWQPWEMCAAIAVTDEGRPGWLQILAARVPDNGDEPESHTVAFDPEGFEQIRPTFETFLRRSEYGLWMAGAALRIAQGLRGGAARYVEPLLERVRAVDKAHIQGTERIDATLRWLYAGGPTLSLAPEEGTGAQFADAWRDWLAQR